ncbi:MAG: amidohydrolase family protein [Thermoplasmata archaeon]
MPQKTPRALTIGGMIYSGSGKFFRGYIRIKENEILEINSGISPSEDYVGIVLPRFVNAHTHIGDAVVEIEPKGTLEELVAPPDGLKFRVLREKKSAEKIEAMKKFARMMESTTSCFVDFREEGIEGVKNLRKALGGINIQVKALGRPVEGSEKETKQLLKISDGIAMSSISDWDYNYLSKLSGMAGEESKMFALHASERSREDIDKVLSLKPDFLVHMCKAEKEDLDACAAKNVPVVVCPRSNLLFGNFPDVPKMLDAGIEVMLGTDNAMFSTPSLFREMELLYRKNRALHYISPETLLKMSVDIPRKFFLGECESFDRGKKPDLMILDLPLSEPAYQVVVRGSEHHIKLSL